MKFHLSPPIAEDHIVTPGAASLAAQEDSELRTSLKKDAFYGGTDVDDGNGHIRLRKNEMTLMDNGHRGYSSAALEETGGKDKDMNLSRELSGLQEMSLTREPSVFSIRPEGVDMLGPPPIDPMVLDRVEDPFEDHQPKLSVLPFAVIIFYSVSGGAFGVEETVRSAGNFYTLLGFLIMPFVWSAQEGLMTAELGSAFPEASGGVAWVQEAFGDCAGWMCGYLGWVSGATDNAIYPVLFVEYLLETLNGDAKSMPTIVKFLLLSGISCLLAYMNWLGLALVGNMSLTICFVALSPFIILSVVGMFQVDPSRWFELPDGAEDQSSEGSSSLGLFSLATLSAIAWRPYLNSMFWNLNSFDSAASFTADIEDPPRTLPRALAISFLLVFGCYFFPLLVALGATTAKQSDWVDGYFSDIAKDIAGPWLEGWLVFAAGISNIGLFQAELSTDAFQLMGMAERGYLPRIFATRSWHGTPTYGILVGLIVIIVMTCISDLDDLIEMLNFNYSLALLLEYGAFLWLRISRPNLERPYRVPLNTFGCFVVFSPTVLAIVAVISLASWRTMVFGIMVNIVGFLIFLIREVKTWQPYSEIGATTFEEPPIENMDEMVDMNGRNRGDEKDLAEEDPVEEPPHGELT
ncbi:hypothetical protein ACA910_009831 [Epithemia clementina (nom. ined.)]